MGDDAVMNFASTAVLAPLFAGGAAIIVGVVTRWTQLGLARDRVRWEARLEDARFHATRFETAQDHLTKAADAANRYLASVGTIDPAAFEEREPFLFPILDSLGRARAEVGALPDFEGMEQVHSSMAMLGKLLTEPATAGRTLELWDEVGMGAALAYLSKARSSVMQQVIDDASLQNRRAWRSRRRLG
ncbi:hypothetical protein [Streptomyces sp. NBC_01257]|uniref:hypothetical protein n=1 Tax=Streptomyces sp. NBC_01257 TaxID=2903799 RepID=UPI002DD8B253|nr:hypothetical protein [Streptomyces sp. NBC_01257]WRZ65784.1 hypothetical protein OG408_18690 [Streptomyces sp. NBC_01257]